MLLHQDQKTEVMKDLATLHLREMMRSTGIVNVRVVPPLQEVKANGVMMHQGNLLLLPADIVHLPVVAAGHQEEVVVAVVVQALHLLHGEGGNLSIQLQIQNIQLQDSLCCPAAPKIKTS